MENETHKSNYCHFVRKNIQILQFLFTIVFFANIFSQKRQKCKQNFTIKFFKNP